MAVIFTPPLSLLLELFIFYVSLKKLSVTHAVGIHCRLLGLLIKEKLERMSKEAFAA